MKDARRMVTLTLGMLSIALAACAPAASAPGPAAATEVPPAISGTTPAAPAAATATTRAAPVATQPAPSSAGAGASGKITVAYSTLNPDPLPVWVAQDQGFFSRNGLDVNLIFIDGGTQTAQAMISGDVKFGVTAPAAAVNATAGGADLVLVSGLVNVINYDFVVQPGIKTADDLKGKKVAWSGPSGSSATATRIALRKLFNLNPDKDVATITIGTETQREAALVSKQIDATVMNPDLAVKAQKDGLVVLAEMWKDQSTPYQHTGIVASRAYLSANADVATRFFKSLIQAIGYTRDPANKDTVIKIMGKYLKVDDQDTLNSGYVRMSQTLLQCAPYGTVDGMKTIVDESKPAKDKGITADQMTDNSYIKALDDDGFIKANCK